MMADCAFELVGLVLLSLALLISMIINILFFLKHKAILCTDTDDCCDPHIHEEESILENEGHYIQDLNHHDQPENPNNHREQQENPIYGNISADRRGSVEVCYEMMTMQRARDHARPSEPDLNYASLDLKVANKHKKKHRHQRGQARERNKAQDPLPARLTPPVNTFLEVETDMDAQLPPRDTSTMVSHSSIYLNSQQIAQEAVDLERERGVGMERENLGWEGMRRHEDGERREWKEERESEEGKDRQDYSNGSVCAQQADAIQSGADHFSSSFGHEGVQQD